MGKREAHAIDRRAFDLVRCGGLYPPCTARWRACLALRRPRVSQYGHVAPAAIWSHSRRGLGEERLKMGRTVARGWFALQFCPARLPGLGGSSAAVGALGQRHATVPRFSPACPLRPRNPMARTCRIATTEEMQLEVAITLSQQCRIDVRVWGRRQDPCKEFQRESCLAPTPRPFLPTRKERTRPPFDDSFGRRRRG